MSQNEIKALISLLDDNDEFIQSSIEEKIISYGESIVPFLEDEWQKNTRPIIQNRIEDLLNKIQVQSTTEKLLFWKENHKDDLLHGLWAIASFEFPNLSLDDVKEQYSNICKHVEINLQANLSIKEKLRSLNHILYDQIQFKPNIQNIDAPNNFFINEVFRTKKGNLISLTIIYYLICKEFQMPVKIIKVPKILLIRYESDNPVYINAFSRGLLFSEQEVIKFINISDDEGDMKECSPLEMISLLISNLVFSFENSHKDYKMVAFVKILEMLKE